jgi:DNA-binding CsgD family transcriptional regulator
MGPNPPILLQARCPDDDDPDIRQLLALIATTTKADSVELELEPEVGPGQRYRVGEPIDSPARFDLDVADFRAVLHLDDAVTADDRALSLASFALDKILRCRRLREQVAVLRGALDTTTSSVFLFDDAGDIVYANPPADQLLSRQTEDDLEVESSGQHNQPLILRICSMAEQVAAGRQKQLPWSTTLAMSDGTVLSCEVMKVEISDSSHHSGVLVVLQPVAALPRLFLEAFCLRHRLTPREREVVDLLLDGLATENMASRLGISAHTVRDHLKRVYRKTGARSRSELLSFLSSARLAPPGQRGTSRSKR